MRPPHRALLGTSLLGLTLVGVGAWKAFDAPATALALFLAAAIVVEVFEEAGRERSREPVETERFHLAAAVQVAAVVLLGPWVAALVAVAGVVSGAIVRGRSAQTVAFRAGAFAAATAAAGLAFRAAGGAVGELKLLDDLIPLVALALVYLTVRAVLIDMLLGREAFDPRIAWSLGEVAFGAVIALLAIAHPWDVIALVPLGLAVHHANLRVTRLQRETLRALETFANIVDERDPSTYRHSLRVAGYVDQLARALRLPFSDIDRLRWAGRLHDLGKVAVDSTVLRKPGRLDREEWAAVRRHPRLSARLLQRFEFVATQARAVELHHERFDGRGYYGVGDEDLPLAAHFLIVADSFDAMTSERPYRPGLSRDQALAEIERNLGTQFHPAVGKAFVAVQRGLDPSEVLTEEELEEIRGASASYRLGIVPGRRDLKERPELLALGGLVVLLAGLGFHETWMTALGAWVGATGIVLRLRARARSERLVESFRAALHAPDRGAIFSDLIDRIGKAWTVSWGALVDWDEDGLGGRIECQRGEGPSEAAVTSWLVREAESGAGAIAATGPELGRDGVALAFPLRRETSALVGFLVVEAPRLPPRHVQLALEEVLDEIGLALADGPASGGSGGENAESLEAASHSADLVVTRLDEG
jgi:HD-GYP domain-containing protein (c-di-GMP phosphodiesterase class II)